MSRTLEQEIKRYEQFANACKYHNLTESQEEFEQHHEWLRELQERRKSDSCEGCVFEEGSFLRCVKCKRNKKYYDRYEGGGNHADT